MSSIVTTQFQFERLQKVLSRQPDLDDWRIGEAMAEAYLTDHRNCQFPWPTGRDLKNMSASPAGTDLVGFHHADNGVRFAFAEVKTSCEERWPPNVVTGRHGLAKQLEDLRDLDDVKDELVKYLGHHAEKAPWATDFQSSAARYLSDSSDVSLFGFLVRDVAPKVADLRSRAASLGGQCSGMTLIELLALYLPLGSVATIVDRVKQAMGALP